MKRSLIVVLLLACLGPLAVSQAAPPVKKVLVFGVDGCRFDAVEKAQTPTFDRLIAAGSLATNTTIIAPRPVTSDTTSGPGWSSLMTGVWSDKHLVISNAFKVRGFDQYPHWFARIKQSQPQRRTVSFDGWGPIHKYVVSAADLSEDVNGGSKDYAAVDRETVIRAVKELREKEPDALFVYLGDIDETGHKHGFHPTVEPYIKAIETVDAQMSEVLAAVAARPRFADEDWLTIVCTDHGGRGKDHGKGHDYPEITTTFLIVSGPSAKHGKLDEPTAMVDVVPTALTHLGIALDPAWGLDGRAVGLKK